MINSKEIPTKEASFNTGKKVVKKARKKPRPSKDHLDDQNESSSTDVTAPNTTDTPESTISEPVLSEEIVPDEVAVPSEKIEEVVTLTPDDSGVSDEEDTQAHMETEPISDVSIAPEEQPGMQDGELSPLVTEFSMNKEHAGITESTEINWLQDAEIIRPTGCQNRSGSGAISIVNNVNGKRMGISTGVLKSLGFPEKVVTLISPSDELIIGSCEDEEEGYLLRGAKLNTIYSAELVHRITKLFDLDFDNRTSRTFGQATYRQIDGKTYAFIKK